MNSQSKLQLKLKNLLLHVDQFGISFNRGAILVYNDDNADDIKNDINQKILWHTMSNKLL